MDSKYRPGYLKQKLRELKFKHGRFTLLQRYKRNTSNIKEFRRVNKVFEHFSGKNVIDIGCNAGYFSILISSFANHVIGIDVDGDLIEKANYFKKITHADNVDFETISAFDIDDKFMKDNKIDAVFVHKVSEPKKDIDNYTRVWTPENTEYVFSLIVRYCNTTICHDINEVDSFFEKENFSIVKFPSYKNNSLYVIKRK